MLRFATFLRLNAAVVACVVSTLVCHRASAQTDWTPLKRHVRSSANVLLAIDFGKLLESPVATKEDWKNATAKAYSMGVTMLPPDTTQAIFASEFDLDTMAPAWEQAIVRLNREPSLAALAKRTHGELTDIEGRAVCSLPGGAMVAVVEPRVAAALAPANRQTMARWLRAQTKEGGDPLSPYLEQSFGYVSELGTPVVLAIDMEHALSTEHVKIDLMEEEEALQRLGVDFDQAVSTIAAIRGAAVGVTFGERAFAKVKVDFAAPVQLKPEVAKRLLLGALERHGDPIDEFHDFTPKVSDKQFTLEGPISASGLRRLFSLFDRPPVLPSETAGDAPKTKPTPANPTPGAEKSEADPTLTYYHQLQDMITDLRREPDKAQTVTPGLKATWLRNYARKINGLPILGVDPELVELSHQISDMFYAAADDVAIGLAKSQDDQNAVQPRYDTIVRHDVYGYGRTGYRWGRWGGYSTWGPYGNTTVTAVPDTAGYYRDRANIRARDRNAALNKSRQALEEAEKALAAMGRKLTQKYSRQF